jgi:hypothetical protein
VSTNEGFVSSSLTEIFELSGLVASGWFTGLMSWMLVRQDEWLVIRSHLPMHGESLLSPKE